VCRLPGKEGDELELHGRILVVDEYVINRMQLKPSLKQ
jgi:hypothetical protein